MRYGPEHKETARAKILTAVGRGFRRRGYDGIGVDGLAKEAGVTSGAFYGHFTSKGEAFEAAALAGLEELRQAVERFRAEEGAAWLGRFVDFYLSTKRTCELGESCALQSLTPEVARAGRGRPPPGAGCRPGRTHRCRWRDIDRARRRPARSCRPRRSPDHRA